MLYGIIRTHYGKVTPIFDKDDYQRIYLQTFDDLAEADKFANELEAKEQGSELIVVSFEPVHE